MKTLRFVLHIQTKGPGENKDSDVSPTSADQILLCLCLDHITVYWVLIIIILGSDWKVYNYAVSTKYFSNIIILLYHKSVILILRKGDWSQSFIRLSVAEQGCKAKSLDARTYILKFALYFAP